MRSIALSDGGLLVSLTIGEWDENHTLFLELECRPAGWVAKSACLWLTTDIIPQIGWIGSLQGRVVVESDSCEQSSPIRCDIDIRNFRRTFEHVPLEDSEELHERLESFDGAPK